MVLGNLDHNDWIKSVRYVPVLKQIETRLLTVLVVRAKRVLKSGDVRQAFVQATLPENENYVLQPPQGCSFTPPKSYWLLKRSLYGLKRSPIIWYDKATSILTSIGLKHLPNEPCIFTGTLIDKYPPIYLGHYVDDFIYFSESDIVEKTFEKIFKVTFQLTFLEK